MAESEITKEQVIEYLSNLSVIDMGQLVSILEESWGVSAQPVAVPGLGGPQTPVEEAPAQTEFDVVLDSFGSSKMPVIKEVRALTNLGLKEAKDKVEGVPSTLAEALSKEQADEWKTKLEAAGAKVTLK